MEVFHFQMDDFPDCHQDSDDEITDMEEEEVSFHLLFLFHFSLVQIHFILFYFIFS